MRQLYFLSKLCIIKVALFMRHYQSGLSFCEHKKDPIGTDKIQYPVSHQLSLGSLNRSKQHFPLRLNGCLIKSQADSKQSPIISFHQLTHMGYYLACCLG